MLQPHVYSVCAIVHHIGNQCHGGHYVATCRVDADRFGFFNDQRSVRLCTWRQVATQATFKQACVIVYTRQPPEKTEGCNSAISQIAETPDVDVAQPGVTPSEQGGDLPSRSSDFSGPLPAERPCKKMRPSNHDQTPRNTSEAARERGRCAVQPTILPPWTQFPGAPDEHKQGQPVNLRGSAQQQDWQRFTPDSVIVGRCVGRTWNHGAGGQCTNRPEPGSDVCKGCRKRGLTHGRIDGPIPEAKYNEFLKVGRKKQ